MQAARKRRAASAGAGAAANNRMNRATSAADRAAQRLRLQRLPAVGKRRAARGPADVRSAVVWAKNAGAADVVPIADRRPQHRRNLIRNESRQPDHRVRKPAAIDRRDGDTFSARAIPPRRSKPAPPPLPPEPEASSSQSWTSLPNGATSVRDSQAAEAAASESEQDRSSRRRSLTQRKRHPKRVQQSMDDAADPYAQVGVGQGRPGFSETSPPSSSLGHMANEFAADRVARSTAIVPGAASRDWR